ncbi:AAA family ATPase [Blastococcus brunescens]|uniref:AAA family ATPase n=1 Tax=Blastococcus brunescens TaxID=1564165 RepID=A0ABZ1B2R6_9ACTN|nr:AAA family ATPase [Blastococcus sp. BMG 8361]WRL65039.1 AAA family ATPase [Blastococcus sp. BMG 8361]
MVSRSPLVAVDGVGQGAPLRLADGALWLDRYWRQEASVAEDLIRRTASPPVVDAARLRAVLTRLWPQPGAHDQRHAAAVSVLSRIAVVGGGPGTGKTTTVARLVAALRALADPEQAPRLALAAPTGKAAARLKEAVDEAASSDEVLEGPTGNCCDRPRRRPCTGCSVSAPGRLAFGTTGATRCRWTWSSSTRRRWCR